MNGIVQIDSPFRFIVFQIPLFGGPEFDSLSPAAIPVTVRLYYLSLCTTIADGLHSHVTVT
jgi:hypothetical protein